MSKQVQFPRNAEFHPNDYKPLTEEEELAQLDFEMESLELTPIMSTTTEPTPTTYFTPFTFPVPSTSSNPPPQTEPTFGAEISFRGGFGQAHKESGQTGQNLTNAVTRVRPTRPESQRVVQNQNPKRYFDKRSKKNVEVIDSGDGSQDEQPKTRLDTLLETRLTDLSVELLIEALLAIKTRLPSLQKATVNKVVCSSANELHDFCLQWTTGLTTGGHELLDNWLANAVEELRKDESSETVNGFNDVPRSKPNCLTSLPNGKVKKLKTMKPQDFVKGTYVVVPEYRNLVPFDDPAVAWHRGQIKEILPHDEISVYLTDYGNELIVSKYCVYKLPVGLDRVTPFCFRAKLSDMRPLSHGIDHDVKNFFLKCMSIAGELGCSIQEEVEKSIYGVVLYKVFRETKEWINIGELLNDFMKNFQEDETDS